MALTYMRRHPERVGSAVLNGVAPPSLRNPLYHARESQRAIDGLFDECAADPPCRAAFPRVRDEFQEVLTRLDISACARVALVARRSAGPGHHQPLRVRRNDPDGCSITPSPSRQVPLAVHRAHQGDFSIVVQRAANSVDRSRGSRTGCCSAPRAPRTSLAFAKTTSRAMPATFLARRSRPATTASLRHLAAARETGRRRCAGSFRRPSPAFVRNARSGDASALG